MFLSSIYNLAFLWFCSSALLNNTCLPQSLILRLYSRVKPFSLGQKISPSKGIIFKISHSFLNEYFLKHSSGAYWILTVSKALFWNRYMYLSSPESPCNLVKKICTNTAVIQEERMKYGKWTIAKTLLLGQRRYIGLLFPRRLSCKMPRKDGIYNINHKERIKLIIEFSMFHIVWETLPSLGYSFISLFVVDILEFFFTCIFSALDSTIMLIYSAHN